MTSPIRRFDRLELWALAWMGLPLVLYVAAWLQAWATVAVLALLAITTVYALRGTRASTDAPLGLPRAVLLLAVATVWVLWSGLAKDLGLALRPNDDWQVRWSVLRDLVVLDWPVGYGPSTAGDELVLRCPMLYYLLPALVGKLAGLPAARLALALQTMLGVLLCLVLVLRGRQRPTWRAVLVLLGVWVMFSGMDYAAHVHDLHLWPHFGEHIEWWFPVLQYSSHTTLLFWVPNHALPGWLAVAILWRHRTSGLDVVPMALLMLLVAAQAPLVAIGLLPIALAASVIGRSDSAWRVARGWLREALHPAALATAPVALLLAVAYTFGRHDEPLPPRPEWWWLIPLWLRFAFVEWAALAAALFWCMAGQRRPKTLLWVACIVLAMLPFFRYGPSNDLVMRGGIAALALLALGCVDVLANAVGSPIRRAVLLLVLLLGAPTAVLEMQRAFLPSRPQASEGSHFVQLWGEAAHYVGALPKDAWLRRVLRPTT